MLHSYHNWLEHTVNVQYILKILNYVLHLIAYEDLQGGMEWARENGPIIQKKHFNIFCEV